MAADEPDQGPLRHEASRRLFFALWPDQAMREAMVHATRNAARASGGRAVPAANLHVTLSFLGSVPQRRLPELAEAGRKAGQSSRCATAGADSPLGLGSVELVFDRLEHWRPARLLCALPAGPPPSVTVLARELQSLLVGCGFAPDLKAFRPHVTVARKIARPGPAGDMHPVVWRFTQLALIDSRTLPGGASYSVVESYSLHG